jgi:hypothetical protein
MIIDKSLSLLQCGTVLVPCSRQKHLFTNPMVLTKMVDRVPDQTQTPLITSFA